MIRSKIAMGFLWALLALLLHVVPSAVGPARSQRSRKDDIVFNSRGIPLAGVTVRVCAMPASGQSCTPLALIYSDTALTQALANPTTTDGLGNYFFYAAPGKYEIEISGPSITTKQIPNVILSNDPSSPTFSGAITAFSLNLNGNLTVNGNTTVVGNLASGTLNLANQSVPPGARSSGTVNLYTKTADKRLYYKDDTGTELGPLGPGAQTNVSNNWTAQQNLNANTRFKGPNPYVDVTRYGVRSTATNIAPMVPGITATINASSFSATISSVSSFQNGDGVMIIGAGAPQSMTAPTPTVTPSIAAGPTGTGIVVTGPTASSTYDYKIVTADKGRGMTVPSAATTITTGQASLGSQSVAITSCTRSGTTNTCTTAAQTLAAGAMVYIQKTSDGSFGGWYILATVPDSTHFTYTSGFDTTSGASTASTGGNVFWFNENYITWSNVAGAQNYIICSDRGGGGFVPIGISQPDNTANSFTDLALSFDDLGSPMMDNFAVPFWATNACTASSPQNDSLVATIASGGGSTTLTLTNSASTSVSGATILFDNAPHILAAANAAQGSTAPVYFPPGNYVVNSYLSLPTFVSFCGGGLFLNDTIQMGSGDTWNGNGCNYRANSQAPQFAFEGFPPITSGRAYPALFLALGEITLRNLQFAGLANSATYLVNDTTSIPSGIFENLNFGQANSTDYMGLFVLFRGQVNPGGVPDDTTFRNIDLVGGPNQVNGATATPLFYCDACAQTIFDNIFLNRRSIAFKGSFTGEQIRVDNIYEQGGLAPVIMNVVNGSNNSSTAFYVTNFVEDTMAHPFYANLNSTINQSITFANRVLQGPSFDGVSVPPIVSGFPTSVTGSTVGSGYNSVIAGSSFSNNVVSVSGIGAIGYAMTGSAAPVSAVVSAGGSTVKGTHSYAVEFQDAFGKSTRIGPTISATTTSGNQTVTITPPAAPVGAVSVQFYQDGLQMGTSSNQCGPYPVTTVFVQTLGFPPCSTTNGGPGPLGASAVSLASSGMATSSLILTGGGFKSTTTGTFTANRTQTRPDVTGYIPVTSYLNSAYDNATRANGAIGSNWTVTNNGINISSNNFVGTSASNDVAFWSASPFSNVQFSQVTLTALNGTSDFSGVAVLVSGRGGSTQGYECVESTTNIFIQKISGTTNTTLTSAASTGAAGDILRLEAAPGGALTCYKNGISTLTTTNTTYSSGSPGLFLLGTVATSKNWSGGNLHPLAQLDSEQDWTKTQHFAQGIALGGAASESFNNNPRAEQNVFLPGALTSTWTGATWTTDKAVTVTRVQVQAKTAPAGCTTNAVVRLTDGTTPVNVTISAGANDSGAISQNYAAGASLTVALQTAAAGCTTSPADANVVVQYRMQ
jgi:hypothetical protein